MEIYSDFINRINYQQSQLQIGDGYFKPSGRVYEKVNKDNSFKPFYGDTVVFDLDDNTKLRVCKIIDELYEAAPECFCEKFDKSILHMTLHDLSASENLNSVSSEIFNNEIRLLQVLNDNPLKPQSIKMKTNFIINMVNTSLVLALVPYDETEWNKLQQLYELVNKVKVCPYPYLTPHITLAYFNYNGFDEDSARKLSRAVAELNRKSFAITLDDKLYYQKFISMKDYISVFKLY